MRILLISPFPLFPNSSGGTERILNIIYFFLKKGHEVTVALPYIYDGTESNYKDLEKIGKVELFKLFSSNVSQTEPKSSPSFLKRTRDLLPFNVAFFTPEKLIKLFIKTRVNSPDVIIAEFDGSWFVGYILAKFLKRELIVDKHNIESVLYYRSMRQSTLRLSKIQKTRLSIVLMLEKLIWEKSGGTVVVSNRDSTLSQLLFGRKNNTIVASNGVDLTATQYKQEGTETRKWLRIPSEGKIIIFHGLGTYGPNIEARERLVHKIFPLINEVSKENVYVVVVGPGNSPANEIKSIGKIRLVGEVSKEKLFQIIWSSDVAVVPLRSGSGTRLKILDYFNAELPVIATSLAAEGLPVQDGVDILIRNDDMEIAQAIVKIFSDEQLRNSLIQNAKQLVKNQFGWETTLRQMESLALQLSLRVDDG